MPNPRTAAEWARGFLASDGFALWVRGEADTGYLERLLANELDAYARQQVGAALATRQAMVMELAEAAEHFRYCDLAGSELEHRCERCVAADLLVVAARREKIAAAIVALRRPG